MSVEEFACLLYSCQRRARERHWGVLRADQRVRWQAAAVKVLDALTCPHISKAELAEMVEVIKKELRR